MGGSPAGGHTSQRTMQCNAIQCNAMEACGQRCTRQCNRKEHTYQRCAGQCNGSPAGGALSPKWLRPSPSTTIHHRHKYTSATSNAMHQGIQASRHCAFLCAVCALKSPVCGGVQCAMYKVHTNAQLHCSVQCEAPVAGYHSHLSEGLR